MHHGLLCATAVRVLGVDGGGEVCSVDVLDYGVRGIVVVKNWNSAADATGTDLWDRGVPNL